MDRRVQDYLIRAHKKVIAHYDQVLQANSITAPERERIRQRLGAAKAELEALSNSVSGSQKYAA